MDYGVANMEKAFDRVTRSKQIHEAVILVENSKGDFAYTKGYGGADQDKVFAIASITKLWTTTCIMILMEQHKLTLEDKLTKYFEPAMLKGLHCYKGKEYAKQITIKELLCQVTGLPDAYEESKNSIKKQVIYKDFSYDFPEMVRMIKELKPHFAPNSKNRSYYADINFDLLGEMIEKVTHLSLDQAYKKLIFEPLGLEHTYLPTSEKEVIPKVYYKEKAIDRPKVIICSRASGGGISTAKELMIFLKAFFGSKLFSFETLKSLSVYRKMQITMGPVCYGCGHMQIPLGGLTTLFQGKGELYGHSGSTGSFAFYYPEKDLFYVGNVNQMANPSIPVVLAMRLAMGSK